MKFDKEAVDNFITATDWNKVWNNGTFSQDNFYPVDDAVDFSKFSLECGASRMVLVPLNPTEKYVIKLPFLYVYNESSAEYYDENLEEWCYEDSYQEICCAPLPSQGLMPYGGYYARDWDYCQTELEYLDLARELHLEKFFPEITKYCEMPYPIYIEERCTASYLNHNDMDLQEARIRANRYFLDEEQVSDSQRYWSRQFRGDWLLDCIEWYGIEQVYKLFDFLEQYEMKDFHSANYGYSAIDGRPLLIDFAGFYEEC